MCGTPGVAINTLVDSNKLTGGPPSWAPTLSISRLSHTPSLLLGAPAHPSPTLRNSESESRLDFVTPSRTSLGALMSIRDESVQRVHKLENMQQMIGSFLHMPDNEADAPA